MAVHTTIERHPLTLASRVLLACYDNPTATLDVIAQTAECTRRAAEANIAALRTVGRLAPGQPWAVPVCWQAMVHGMWTVDREWAQTTRQDTP